MVPHPHESEVIFLLVIRFGSSFSLWFHHKFVPVMVAIDTDKPGHQPNQRIMICYSKCYPFANQTDQGSASIPRDRSSEPPRPALDAMGPLFTEPHAGPGSKWFQQVSTGGSWGHVLRCQTPHNCCVITPAKICSQWSFTKTLGKISVADLATSLGTLKPCPEPEVTSRFAQLEGPSISIYYCSYL
jgi:hypothetical protein